MTETMFKICVIAFVFAIVATLIVAPAALRVIDTYRGM